MFPQMKKIGKIRQVLESFKKGSWSLQKASPLTYYHTEIEISQKCFQLIKRPKIGGKIPIYATKCFNSSNNSAG